MFVPSGCSVHGWKDWWQREHCWNFHNRSGNRLIAQIQCQWAKSDVTILQWLLNLPFSIYGVLEAASISIRSKHSTMSLEVLHLAHSFAPDNDCLATRVACMTYRRMDWSGPIGNDCQVVNFHESDIFFWILGVRIVEVCKYDNSSRRFTHW